MLTSVEVVPHTTKIKMQFAEWGALMHEREEPMAGQGERSTVDLSEKPADEQPKLGWKINLESEGQYAGRGWSSGTNRVPLRLHLGVLGFLVFGSAPQWHFILADRLFWASI